MITSASSSVSSPSAKGNIQIAIEFPLELFVNGVSIPQTHGGGVFEMSKAPFRVELPSLPNTIIVVNVRDAFSLKGQPTFDPLSLTTTTSLLPEYADLSPTRWRIVPGMNHGKNVSYTVKGVFSENGHWQMLSYPFNDLLFTFAAIPVNEKGTLQTIGIKYSHAYLRLKNSDDSDCRLFQNMWRNAGGTGEPPSCDEILK